jgi:hypothetical protein
MKEQLQDKDSWTPVTTSSPDAESDASGPVPRQDAPSRGEAGSDDCWDGYRNRPAPPPNDLVLSIGRGIAH